MKILRLTTILCFIAHYSLGQTNTFPSSDNVGIGTINPVSPLTIKSGYDAILTLQASDDNWLYTNWLDKSGSCRVWMGLGSDLSSFNIKLEGETDKILLQGGNVGIGINNPNERLHVAGIGRFRALKLDGNNSIYSVNGFTNKLEFIGGQNGAIVFHPGQSDELMFGMHNNGNF